MLQSSHNFQEMPAFHWLLTLGMYKAQHYKIIVVGHFCLNTFTVSTYSMAKLFLLHIICGYQCDKAVNKNDTGEVIRYHFTGFELSNQIDCNNLVGPIRLYVIF